jgi:hypothetical protein
MTSSRLGDARARQLSPTRSTTTAASASAQPGRQEVRQLHDQAGISQPADQRLSVSFTAPAGRRRSARHLYSPMLGGPASTSAPISSTASTTRKALAQQYRSRPLTQITDQRFVDTGNIAAKGDDSVGSSWRRSTRAFHFAAEAQKVWVRHAYSRPSRLNIDGDNNDTTRPAPHRAQRQPVFSGRLCRGRLLLHRRKPRLQGRQVGSHQGLKPFDQGGWGAIQLNGRLDYVDLNDGSMAMSTAARARSPRRLRQWRQAARLSGSA